MKGNILLIAFSILTISLIITINFFLQENYQAEMAEQFNKQQLLLANSVSNNIRNHVEHLEKETLALSTLLGERDLHSPQLKSFVDDAFAEIKSEDGIDLKIFTREGRLVYSNPASDATEDDLLMLKRAALSDTGDIVFHDMTAQKRIVKLAASITGTSGPNGTIVLNLYLDPLNEEFLAPLTSGRKGYAWMMDKDGTLLYHPTQPAMVGKNLYRTDTTCFKCHKSFEMEKWILRSGEVGAKSYLSPFGEDKLIAFTKLNIFNTQWIICVSIPYSEITASIRKSMRLHSILVLLIFGATVFGAFTIIVINRKRIKAEERARHDEELKRYANRLEALVGERTKELTTEKDKLNTILSAISGGLILLGTDGKVQWANRNVKDMAGQSLTGKYISDIFPDHTFISTLSEDALKTDILHNLFGMQGSYFQVTTAPVKSNDEIVGFLKLILDVTEMKRVEDHMANSEKLASLGRLTAGIAHEIGNPLTSVFSFLQILKENETDDFKKESLDTIMFHITRIADIVRQLSGLSKVPASELKDHSLNGLVESSLSLLQYDKRAKDINIIKNLADNLPTVRTDGNQLSQVFVNLILNAVDSMPDGGTLTIKSTLGDDFIKVDFQDTGCGIPADKLGKVFDPFFTTKDKGTGLGLSVSYGIVKRLGGDITVKSEIGEGTWFTVKVPLKAVANEG